MVAAIILAPLLDALDARTIPDPDCWPELPKRRRPAEVHRGRPRAERRRYSPRVLR